MKILRILILLGISAIAVIPIKDAQQKSFFRAERGISSVSQIDKWISFLYENNCKGKVSFFGKKGYSIAWKPAQEREKKEKAFCPKVAGVTYGFSQGRLGDNLLSFLHAKWIVHRYELPFFYLPFPHSDHFALSEREPLLPSCEKTMMLEHEQNLAQMPPSALLEIPYFPEPSMKNHTLPFLVDWDDPDFREEIIRSLAPIKSHETLSLPQDRITIGVHVRRGGNFDSPSLHYEYPLKFPPDSYFFEQIKRISKIFKDKPLYVFLLTDDLHPEELLAKYKKAVPLAQIEWACRSNKEAASDHTLDDFFSIPLFDCLILCDSNFSITASKMTEYAIRISPTHYRKKKGKAEISGIELHFNPDYQTLAKYYRSLASSS